MENENKKEIQINILEVVKDFARKWWIIFLAALVGALSLFCYKYFTTEQEYTATGKIYVNSDRISISSYSISMSDVTLGRSLVDSYAVILKTRRMLEDVVLQKANNERDEQGNKLLSKEYTYDELLEMISVGAVNDTEIFYVSVTCSDPDDAIVLTNTILSEFPIQIKDIIKGSTAEIVDYARVAEPVSRGLTKMALIGFAVGLVLALVVIFVIDFYINDTIQNADNLKQYLPDDIPVLAIVPDTNESSLNKYGYKKGYYKNSYYKHRDDYSYYYAQPSEEKEGGKE